MVDWKRLMGLSGSALDNFKETVGAEILQQILSIPDTIAFIEFIYEEAAQTALFAIYQAHKNGQDEMARQILDYLQFQLLPDAVGMVASWGALNPATQTAFQRFFDAVEYSIQMWDLVLTSPKEETGTLVIYTNVNDVSISIEGEYKGTAGPVIPLKLKLEPGSYTVEAKKDGYQVEARNVNLKPGDYYALKINMKPLT